MDSPAVSSRLFPTTLTFRTPQENHIVSVPFETIEKNKKNVFSVFLESPGHLGTIQYLIPGWTTIVKLLKQVKNGQSPSRDPWSNCLINSRETTKGQINYYSGRPKDNSKTICGRPGYTEQGLRTSTSITLQQSPKSPICEQSRQSYTRRSVERKSGENTQTQDAQQEQDKILFWR